MPPSGNVSVSSGKGTRVIVPESVPSGSSTEGRGTAVPGKTVNVGRCTAVGNCTAVAMAVAGPGYAEENVLVGAGLSGVVVTGGIVLVAVAVDVGPVGVTVRVAVGEPVGLIVPGVADMGP